MTDVESQNSDFDNAHNKPKSQYGQDDENESPQNERTQTAATSEDIDNPFKVPSDALIFTFKEDEKLRKLQERENNRQLRIWEKNRPIREGCLKKLRETDI